MDKEKEFYKGIRTSENLMYDAEGKLYNFLNIDIMENENITEEERVIIKDFKKMNEK